MAIMQEGPTAVSVDLHAEVRIAASVDVVWRSLVEDVGAWWPHSFSEEPKISMEPWVGGRFMEEWDGGSALYALVTHMVTGATAHDQRPDGDARRAAVREDLRAHRRRRRDRRPLRRRRCSAISTTSCATDTARAARSSCRPSRPMWRAGPLARSPSQPRRPIPSPRNASSRCPSASMSARSVRVSRRKGSIRNRPSFEERAPPRGGEPVDEHVSPADLRPELGIGRRRCESDRRARAPRCRTRAGTGRAPASPGLGAARAARRRARVRARRGTCEGSAASRSMISAAPGRPDHARSRRAPRDRTPSGTASRVRRVPRPWPSARRPRTPAS